MPETDYFLKMPPDVWIYREYGDPPPILPGRAKRDWMEATTEKFAYRCTPLPMANCSGWEIVLPFAVEAVWNGGNLPGDIRLTAPGGEARLGQIVGSVFGHGIITFHPGYLFQTSGGWAINVRGAPNTVKDGIVPLEGLVETDWLPFTFTMNWRFTRPGWVRFEADEPFCFLSLVPHGMLDAVQPQFRGFETNPDLQRRYHAWRNSRSDFQARVAQGEPGALAEGWQKLYVQGRDATGEVEPVFHLSKRRLNPPD